MNLKKIGQNQVELRKTGVMMASLLYGGVLLGSGCSTGKLGMKGGWQNWSLKSSQFNFYKEEDRTLLKSIQAITYETSKLGERLQLQLQYIVKREYINLSIFQSVKPILDETCCSLMKVVEELQTVECQGESLVTGCPVIICNQEMLKGTVTMLQETLGKTVCGLQEVLSKNLIKKNLFDAFFGYSKSEAAVIKLKRFLKDLQKVLTSLSALKIALNGRLSSEQVVGKAKLSEVAEVVAKRLKKMNARSIYFAYNL